MGRKTSINLYVGPGGVDRNISDDTKQAFLDAMDVWAPRNGVQSRPSFRYVAAGPQEVLPAGRVFSSQGGITAVPTRRLASAASNGTWYVGCLDPFDGVSWEAIISVTGTPTTHKRAVLEYQSAQGVWTPLQLIADTTIRLDSAGNYSESLAKSGAVHFRRPSGWVVTTLSGWASPAYWIRIRLVNIRSGSVEAPGFTWTLARPGVRAFTRSPLTSLVRLPRGSDADLALVSRRSPARGYEAGSRISRWAVNPHVEPQALSRQVRRAAGKYGQYQPNNPYRASLGGPGTLGTAVGAPDTVQDGAIASPPYSDENRYNYLLNQPYGSVLIAGVVAGVGGTTSVFQVSGILFDNFPAGASLEGAWIQATSGLNSGSVREIAGYDASATPEIRVSDPFGSVVAFGDTFNILAPPSNVSIDEAGDVEFPITGPAAASSFPVAPFGTLDSIRTPADYISAGPVAFRITRPVYYDIRGQEFWSSVFDPRTGVSFIATGDATLEWDGVTLKEAECDVSSSFAQAALSASVITTTLDPSARYNTLIDRSLWRKIPPAKQIISHDSTFFALDPDGYKIWHSMPGDASRVWPFVNLIEIHTQGAPLEGMISYSDKIIAWSKDGIYEIVKQSAEAALYTFRQMISGSGFGGQNAVCLAPLAETMDLVVGVHAGGIRAYAGGQTTAVLDAWDTVADVDVSKLSRAVSAVWRQEACVIFGLTEVGRNIQDLIVLYDYQNKAFWKWRAPFGIRSITVIPDITGKEIVLIGTEDGALCTLTEYEASEDPFTGFIKTRFMKAKDGVALRPSLVHVTTANVSSLTTNIALFADQRDTPWLDGEYPIDLGEARYDAVTSVWNNTQYAAPLIKAAIINVPSGLTARQLAVQVSMPPRARVEAISVDTGTISKKVR